MSALPPKADIRVRLSSYQLAGQNKGPEHHPLEEELPLCAHWISTISTQFAPSPPGYRLGSPSFPVAWTMLYTDRRSDFSPEGMGYWPLGSILMPCGWASVA